ncbi:MAG TPA: ABC transporter permease [Bryobacteraceae bacterium]|nr:ABC transporter permease [Bryobacteraceae bacterium]
MQQWKLALRSLTRRKGFAAAVVAILALGIGANTAVFSVVDRILLKPLPYPDSGRLVSVLEASPSKSEPESLIAPVRLDEWNRMNRTFEGIAASYTENVTDTSEREPARLAGRRVSPGYFRVFGTKALAGRTFTPEEDQAGGPTSAVISYTLWTRRYHQAPETVGRRLVLSGTGYTIVGVMPPEFASSAIDVWLPAQVNAFLMRIREARFYAGTGRMKPGVTIAQAQTDLARVQRQLGELYPGTDKGWSALVRSLKEMRVGDYRKTLLFVFGAVALLLLIAVANIAGLMLTQLQRRAREMAIRSSIGATRMQVLGVVMREIALMAVLGAAVGCAVAGWLLQSLGKFFSALQASRDLVGQRSVFDLGWPALAFAALAGTGAAMLCGMLPAMAAMRANLAAILAQAGRGGSGSSHRWQRVLVGAQVALTVLLLASAGLMLRSYYNLARVDPGFDAGHTLTFHMGAAWNEDRTRVGQMQEALLDRLSRTPGVETAGFANFLPASGATLRYQVSLSGDNRKITAGERSISRGYLQSLGAPILAGEDCPDLRKLGPGQPAKALVNRRFVELYGQGRNLVGEHLRMLDVGGPSDAPAIEIAGIAGDLREDALNVAPGPYFYMCISPGGWPDPEYVVRAHGSPLPLEQAIRPIVRQIDPARAVFGLKTLSEVLDESLDEPRLKSGVVMVFALAAMLLASVGLYSLVSQVVTARTREIGVRMTLGARPRQIVGELVAGVGRLLAIGGAAGLGLTWMAGRLLRAVLFGVSPMDAITLGGAMLALAVVSAIAALVPARRAARIDPLAAIRAE